MSTFPVRQSDRLQLRVLAPEDIAALVRHGNNRRIAERVLNVPYPYREPDAVFRLGKVRQGFKKGTHFSFAIIHKEAEELVGEIGLYPLPNGTQGQVAYWIAEPYWGQGLATEALQAILAFGFEERHLQLIFAECKRDNLSSIRVLEKNEMQAVGTGRSVEQYYVKRSTWEQRQG